MITTNLRSKISKKEIQLQDIQPKELIGSVSSGKVCLVCTKNTSSYCCPHCYIPYCSSVCYTKHDIRCTERFNRQRVKNVLEYEKKTNIQTDDLKRNESNENKKKKVLYGNYSDNAEYDYQENTNLSEDQNNYGDDNDESDGDDSDNFDSGQKLSNNVNNNLNLVNTIQMHELNINNTNISNVNNATNIDASSIDINNMNDIDINNIPRNIPQNIPKRLLNSLIKLWTPWWTPLHHPLQQPSFQSQSFRSGFQSTSGQLHLTSIMTSELSLKKKGNLFDIPFVLVW